MPSEFLHAFVGLKITKHLGILNKHNFKEVVLGSQGPDVFLYMPFEKDIVFFGKFLHDKQVSSQFIKHLGENIKDYPAFAIAFMSHFILDNLVHPYINARTKDSVKHGQLERAIDRAFMEYIGKSARNFKFSTALPGKVSYKIDIALRDSIKATNPSKPYLVGYYSASFQYMKLYHSVYDYAPFAIETSAHILKKVGINALCEGLRSKPFKDPLNISRRKWTYKGEIHYEDVIYLTNRAIEIGIEKGKAYLNGSPLSTH